MQNNWLTITKEGNDVILDSCSKEAEGEIVIPDGVTKIGLWAFYGCSGLTSVTIPSSVTSIGKSAFYGCSGLTSVTIPSSVTSIHECAFRGCSGLTSVTIPSSVTSIDDFAFEECSGMTSVTIPSSVTSIDYSAFRGCSGLTSVTIPSSVTSIGECAFAGCSGLTSVTIPSSVTSIGKFAFYGCSGLTSVTFNAANCNDMGSSWYPVFSGCTNLTTVTIGENVTKIPAYAFAGCRGLTSVTIPSSVTSIGKAAFSWCSFKKLLFEGNLPEDKDGYSIFDDCEIEELWVNTPRKKTVISNGLQNAIEQSDGRVIYAIPALCEEDSKIPGYIRATLVNNDELIDINTKCILSVEPYELKDKYEKYQPHTGTLMTCASNGIERRCQILVYEPHEMVVHKIAKSLTMLSQQVGGIAGLLNQIDTLFKHKME